MFLHGLQIAAGNRDLCGKPLLDAHEPCLIHNILSLCMLCMYKRLRTWDIKKLNKVKT